MIANTAAAALLLAAAVATSPATAQDVPAPTQTLSVTGCNGCTITVGSESPGFVDANGGSWPSALVTNEQVAFHMQPGWEVWFEIDDPKRQNSWTWTGIVIRYKGKSPGQPVTRKFANKARGASVYWTVPAADVTLPVRVDDLGRTWEPVFSRWDRYYRAYLTTTGQNSQPLVKLPKGEHGRYGSNGPS